MISRAAQFVNDARYVTAVVHEATVGLIVTVCRSVILRDDNPRLDAVNNTLTAHDAVKAVEDDEIERPDMMFGRATVEHWFLGDPCSTGLDQCYACKALGEVSHVDATA